MYLWKLRYNKGFIHNHWKYTRTYNKTLSKNADENVLNYAEATMIINYADVGFRKTAENKTVKHADVRVQKIYIWREQ